nr:MAG TPA: hypothetical protein [Bacteriophage sp.]DAS30827.1 MAG TPA: hypothetical protein [Caudoviricetes sp.]
MQWSDKPLCTSTILFMVLRNICTANTNIGDDIVHFPVVMTN